MDEKDKKIAMLEEENRILKELVAALTARIAELEAKLKKNSKNSNKPPYHLTSREKERQKTAFNQAAEKSAARRGMKAQQKC